MSRRWTKLLALTAVSAVAAGLLTSCSGTSGASDEEVTELIIPTVEAPWLGGFQKIVADYEAETGVKVTLKVFPFDGLLTQEANAAQTGSNAFDAYLLNEQWVGQFYDNEWVQPLTDVDPSFELDPNLISFDGVGQWDQEARSTTPSGVSYSLPINGNIHLFMYRKDLYEQVGLTVPTTWEEVIENGEQAKSAGAVDHGYVLRGKIPTYDFTALMYTYGAQWFEDERAGNWNVAVDSPETREALEQFKRLAEIGPASPQTVAQAEAIALMQSGTVLQTTLVAANAAPLEDASASLVAGKMGYALLPGETPVSGTWTLGIPTGLPDNRAEATYDFMTWLTGQEAMQKWEGYGGVITRSDVQSDRPEIETIVDSAEYIRAGLRYPFTPAMLDFTDPAITEYLAGTMDLEETITALDDGLKKVVTDAGFLQ